MALTDRNTMAGAVEFYSIAREAGLNAIIGAWVDDPRHTGRSAVLLCRNVGGYHRLCEIISGRQLDPSFDLIRALCEENRGLFVLSCSLELLTGVSRATDQLYGELVLLSGRRQHNRLVHRLCQERRIPMILTNEVCFANREDFEMHRVLRAVAELRTVCDEQLITADSEQYLKSSEVMVVLGRAIPDAIDRTRQIASLCQFEFTFKRYHCARFITPEGEKCSSSSDFLRTLAYEGLERRYVHKCRPLTLYVRGRSAVDPSASWKSNNQFLVDRVEYELEVITNLNFADYFLICWDIVNFARRNGFWHVGRGSAANSIVSYCLGLTEVDPIRYNLYFERFLNYARGSPPDIDLDFSWRHRDQVLRYVYERYGSQHVAMLASIHTLHARGALREVAKAHGISERELNTFRKLIPHTAANHLPHLKEKYPEARELKLDDTLFNKILRLATGLDGYPHYSGIHSSGVVITEQPITHFSALERSSNGFVKTQLDMYSGEDIGLAKIDVLAVRGLGTIEDAVRNIESARGGMLDIRNWDRLFHDEKTRALLRSGRSIGVVHAESPFIRNAMRITGADSFELVYIISGMVRTGCVESGMMYMFIDRLLNSDKRNEAHPALMEILPETFGVMIFEEDVIKVLHYVGGLALDQADIVRRYMSGKRINPLIIQNLKKKFFRNSMRKFKSLSAVETLWTQIRSFSGFSFCKAHSASYALMSFQGAYLKAHYPAYYMAAVLSNEGGFYTPAAYVSECRRLGLKILPPDINKSDRDYRAEGESAIRIGLRFIANVSAAALDVVMKARECRPFDSLQDFLQRASISHEEILTLIKIGCFDFTGKKRTVLIALLDVLTHLQTYHAGVDLFHVDLTRYEHSLKGVDDLLPEERLALEVELLGYYVDKHPLEYFPRQVHHRSIVQAKDLARYKGQKVKMIGWLVSAKRIKTRSKVNSEGEVVQEGRYMKFMTLEDLTGIYDTVLFPDIYERVASQTLSVGPFCLEGVVDGRYNTVNVSRIELIHAVHPQYDVQARMIIEKQEAYAKQKTTGYSYEPEFMVPMDVDQRERAIRVS
jgi:DNA-directed DNA polymerase III PolC